VLFRPKDPAPGGRTPRGFLLRQPRRGVEGRVIVDEVDAEARSGPASQRIHICLGCGELYETAAGNGQPGYCVQCRTEAITGGREAVSRKGAAPNSGAMTSAVRRMRRALIESGVLSRAAAAPIPVTQPGQILQGRYKVLHELGVTLMSQVYLAIDDVLSRKVVIKYLNLSDQPGLVDRFRREATLLASLKHPNIVSVYDSGLERGRPYIVMEYVEGIDLERFNAGLVQGKDEASRIRRILEVVYELCHALDYLHSQGIVHRDIKPTNIMLDRLGKPYIIDFGVAKQDAALDRMTGAGAVLGTLLYMAPEQAEGRGDQVDGRSDLYSLGIMLYQLLVGSLPFKGRTYEELMRNVQGMDPPPPSKTNSLVSSGVDRVVLKCIARSREHRYQSAGELARDLESFVVGGKAEVIGPSQRSVYVRLRLPLAISLILVAVILVLILLLPTFGTQPGGGPAPGARPGRVKASVEENFESAVLPAGFDRVIGSAEVRGGKLWLSEGMVLFGAARAADWFELSVSIEPDGARLPEEIRIGMIVDRADPSVRGVHVRLHPGPGEGVVRTRERVLARFPLPEWSQPSRRIDLIKRGATLELKLDSRLLLEVEIPSGTGPPDGAFSLQVIGGALGVDSTRLVVREGSE
jgi:predicted Ser/Thr protein kinase